MLKKNYKPKYDLNIIDTKQSEKSATTLRNKKYIFFLN